MVERRKLGKGLSTLIPTTREDATTPTTTARPKASQEELPASALRDVPTSSIEPNPH